MTENLEIVQGDGATVLRFIRLDNPGYAARWYGGTVGDWARELMPFAHGPHVWHTIKSMLDLVAEIAAMPEQPLGPYRLQGATKGIYASPYIGRLMNASEIATALGCAVADVTAHYDLIVKVT